MTEAFQEMAEFILLSIDQRKKLRAAGWERVLDPPLVGNQWLWRHPRWFVQLESEAIRILEGE